MKKITIGTRGSLLAVAQTQMIQKKLENIFPDIEFVIKKIVTSGDKDLVSNWNNSENSLKSFFTKEIEVELLNGTIDLAVHSMKDMPIVSPPGLICGAIPDREDPRDVIISKTGETLENLPEGAIVGTSSLRRTMNLKNLRKDLKIKQLRGNIHTRLNKLENEDYDAILLAAAGLKRVGLQDKITEALDPNKFLPAPAQGVLYIQCRENDSEIREILKAIHNEKIASQVAIEREFSKIFDGGCHTPMGCYSEMDGENITFKGIYFKGEKSYSTTVKGNISEGIKIAQKAAKIIKEEISKTGKVYILGAGPGDAELLTLKGKRVIEEADVLVYDRLINPRILKFAKKDAELIYLGKGNTEGGVIQDEINKTLVQKALEGKVVTRVKGGDPFVFGRGGEEILDLVKAGIKFEEIPGITSSISVPAYAGIPVTHRGIARSFHVFTGHTMKDGKWHNFDAIAKLEGTLVFLMGIKNLEKITTDLINNGKNPETPIAIIEKGATASQRVTTGKLNTIVEIAKERKIVPPAIIIIGDVVNLRDDFSWFEKSELFGKKILVTRDSRQADKFSKKIEKLGGEAVELPFIEIKSNDLEINKEFLSKYTMILFNSPNGVREFMGNVKLKDFATLASLKIGVVGSKTKEVLESYSLEPDFMPKEYLIDRLAEEASHFSSEEDNILIITSDISPCDPEKYKKLYNRNFEKIVAYRTEKIIRDKDEVLAALNGVNVITFLSSSTVDAFIKSIDFDLDAVKGIKFASIGPVTSKTMKKYGMNVDFEAKIYDTDGVIESIK